MSTTSTRSFLAGADLASLSTRHNAQHIVCQNPLTTRNLSCAVRARTHRVVKGGQPVAQHSEEIMTGQNQADPIFGEVIHSYTRAQALEDGVLVDVTATAREAGFRIPVDMTRTAFDDCVTWSEEDTRRQTYQDESGRLWDVLWMASLAARRGGYSRMSYTLYRVPRGGRAARPKLTRLDMICGPGDAGEPVITIMLPGED